MKPLDFAEQLKTSMQEILGSLDLIEITLARETSSSLSPPSSNIKNCMQQTFADQRSLHILKRQDNQGIFDQLEKLISFSELTGSLDDLNRFLEDVNNFEPEGNEITEIETDERKKEALDAAEKETATCKEYFEEALEAVNTFIDNNTAKPFLPSSLGSFDPNSLGAQTTSSDDSQFFPDSSAV